MENKILKLNKGQIYDSSWVLERCMFVTVGWACVGSFTSRGKGFFSITLIIVTELHTYWCVYPSQQKGLSEKRPITLCDHEWGLSVLFTLPMSKRRSADVPDFQYALDCCVSLPLHVSIISGIEPLSSLARASRLAPLNPHSTSSTGQPCHCHPKCYCYWYS